MHPNLVQHPHFFIIIFVLMPSESGEGMLAPVEYQYQTNQHAA